MYSLLISLFSMLLIVTPGAWIAFTVLDGRFEYSARLALSIVFSPFIIGTQMLALTTLGISFDGAAKITLLNCLSLPFLFSGRRTYAPRLRASAVWPAVCLLILSASHIALWTLVPNFRLYSFHNMMQAAVVYELVHLP